MLSLPAGLVVMSRRWSRAAARAGCLSLFISVETPGGPGRGRLILRAGGEMEQSGSNVRTQTHAQTHTHTHTYTHTHTHTHVHTFMHTHTPNQARNTTVERKKSLCISRLQTTTANSKNRWRPWSPAHRKRSRAYLCWGLETWSVHKDV